MLSRIHSFFLGIWERNQRFKPALIATWGIALAWFFVLVSGNLSWLLQKNNFSSALLAAGVVALVSVPWRLYNERYDRVELRRDAACFLFFLLLWRFLERLPGTGFSQYVLLVLVGLIPFCLGLSLFFCDSREGKPQLFGHFVVAGVKTLLLAAVVNCMLGLCYTSVSLLLYPLDLPWMLWISYLSFGVAGFQYFISCIPKADDPVSVPPFYTTLWKRILLPCAIFLLLVIYQYLVRSLWQKSLPVGLMNPFGLFLMAVYALLYFSFWKGEPAWQKKALHWGALMLIPVLIGQFAGLQIRLSAYSLTSLRYLSLCCTGFGICTLVCGFFRWKPRKLYLLSSLLTLVLILTPLNLIDLSAWFQARRLDGVLARNQLVQGDQLASGRNLSPEDSKLLRSSFAYLSHSPSSWRYPNVERIRQQPWFLASLPRDGETSVVRTLQYTAKRLNQLNVAGYRTMTLERSFTIQDGKLAYGPFGQPEQTWDVQPFLDQLQKKYPSGGTVPPEDLEINLDETHRLILLHLGGFNAQGGKRLIARGYLLTK